MEVNARRVSSSSSVVHLQPLTFKLDPNMPKRGLSAYMFFANDQRDKVRDENPGIKFGMFNLIGSHIAIYTDASQAR